MQNIMGGIVVKSEKAKRVLLVTSLTVIIAIAFTCGFIAGLGNTRFVIDGIDKLCDPAPIVRGGVTFIPLDFVPQAFSIPVKYDEYENVVYIGEIPGGVDMVNELKPYESGGSLSANPTIIAGDAYNHGFWDYASWNLRGNFRRVVVRVGQDDRKASSRFRAVADGKTIVDTDHIVTADGIKEISIDVRGVNVFKIDVAAYCAFLNPMAYQ